MESCVQRSSKGGTSSRCHRFKALDAVWFQPCLNSNCIFPECIARVPVLGVEGVFARRCVSVRTRPQPLARLLYGRAYGKFCGGGHFWRFQTSRCFVSRGKRGTSWHSDVFCNVSKVVLCGRCNTFATFSEDALQFSWQAQHFWTCRVECFLQIALAGLRQVAISCKFRGRRGIFWHVLKIDGSLARNIDFQVAKFGGSYENSEENVDFEATKCENWKKTRTKCSSWCSHLSRLGLLVFWWLRRVYGGSCKTCPFGMFQTMKIGGNLARNAGFDVPTCLVSSLWFSCGIAVSLGEAPTLYTSHSTIYALDSTLHTLHCTLHSSLLTWDTPHFTLYTPHSSLYTLHSSLHTPHFTLLTRHFTLHTLHSTLTLYTPHSSLLTSHYTFHSTLHTLHFTLYTPHSTL